ncbi:MAG: hypothetical protein ABI813_05165 [Bacteroidota bacterium]
MVKFYCLLILFSFLCYNTSAQNEAKSDKGADEKTPSKSQYFSWINNTNEGATETQTLINLDFFHWLNKEYGMSLDIYAFDAGAIDGKGFCGSMSSPRFRKQFPRSFDVIYQNAKSIGTRLGIWGGPDCFGATPESEQARIDMMVSLCKQYNFELFKFDGVNGTLREEKQDAFVKMMKKCREYSPDLILLNHRLKLGKGMPYATTFLFEGAETYVDVHMANTTTATHHRQGVLSRKLVPGLQRLTEDHGVCLSSCLDYWDDDLILQAFNRSLILAPEIYGNPWLLKDDEYPKLARIFNLHKRFGSILVNGKELPEDKYGEKAVSRGDDETRFITLRNLNWNAKKITLQLDEEIGLKKGNWIEVRQLHPVEKIIGKFKKGSRVEVEIDPFRSSLILATSIPLNEIGIQGSAYTVIKDLDSQVVKINLLGLPGTKATISLSDIVKRKFTSATIDNKLYPLLTKGKSINIQFEGNQLKENWHRKLGDLNKTDVPTDAEALYEATCFAADNNALEVRSLKRSGKTAIKEVQAARDAFFSQAVFIDRSLWDKYLFDGDIKTGFGVKQTWAQKANGIFRLDLGEVVTLDSLILTAESEWEIQPLKTDEATWVEVSVDLVKWQKVVFLSSKKMIVDLSGVKSLRYLRFQTSFGRLVEIDGFYGGKQANRRNWRASNLFSAWRNVAAKSAWTSTFTLNEIVKHAYLCVAINGEHGVEGAYAALRFEGNYVGSPDRSVSFLSNTWEASVQKSKSNYTYYIPVTESMKGKKIEVVVLGMKDGTEDIKPEVWLTTQGTPYVVKELILR